MIENLLRYQEIDKGLRKIETELASCPERKNVIVAKKYLEGVEESVNKLDLRAAELMDIYNTAKENQEKLKEQQAEIEKAMETVEDETGATYLLKKSEELLNKIKWTGSELKKVLGEISNVLAEYSKIKETVSEMKAQYTQNLQKYNDIKESKKEEKEGIEKQLLELKKDVSEELMERYLDKRKNNVFPAILEVNGNICGYCNMELPMSELAKLKNGEIIECEQCRRLLYKK